jgi:integrase/recombinase XerD
MTQLEGRIWLRQGKDGKNRYYYRRFHGFFENGVKKYRDIRRSLGTSLERAQRDAKKLDAEYEASKDDPTKRGATLEQFVSLFVSHIRDERKLLGWDSVQSNLNVIQRSMGNAPLRQIKRLDFEKFLNSKKYVVRPTTANSYLRDAKRMFNTAVEQGYLESSPVAGIKPVRASARPIRIPTQEEVGKLFAYLKTRKPWLYRILLVLAGTGCRLGEALTLTWSEVDFIQETVTFQRRKVQDFHKVPMGQLMKDELWVLWTEKGMPKQGLVFLSQAEKQFTRGRMLLAFKPVAKRLGMPWITLKTFRKLAATQAAESTGDVRTAQMLLGHTSVRTTELYLGRGAEAKARAVKAMDSFLSGAIGTVIGTQAKKEESVKQSG